MLSLHASNRLLPFRYSYHHVILGLPCPSSIIMVSRLWIALYGVWHRTWLNYLKWPSVILSSYMCYWYLLHDVIILPLTFLKQKSFNSHILHLWSYSHSMNLPFTCSTEDHNLVRIFLPGNWWLSWRIKGSSCHCWNRWLSICLYLADLLWLFLFFCSKLASQIYWHVWPWELTLFLQQDFSVLWECTRQDAKWVSLLLFFNDLQKKPYPFIYVGCFVISSSILNQEFEDSGDPEKHLQDLLTLAKEGKEKGKVCSIFLYIRLWNYWTTPSW